MAEGYITISGVRFYTVAITTVTRSSTFTFDNYDSRIISTGFYDNIPSLSEIKQMLHSLRQIAKRCKYIDFLPSSYSPIKEIVMGQWPIIVAPLRRPRARANHNRGSLLNFCKAAYA